MAVGGARAKAVAEVDLVAEGDLEGVGASLVMAQSPALRLKCLRNPSLPGAHPAARERRPDLKQISMHQFSEYWLRGGEGPSSCSL